MTRDVTFGARSPRPNRGSRILLRRGMIRIVQVTTRRILLVACALLACAKKRNEEESNNPAVKITPALQARIDSLHEAELARSYPRPPLFPPGEPGLSADLV